jgi:hypothetical protein
LRLAQRIFPSYVRRTIWRGFIRHIDDDAHRRIDEGKLSANSHWHPSSQEGGSLPETIVSGQTISVRFGPYAELQKTKTAGAS